MSSKPWIAWYTADYRAKTAHLTFCESEAYRRLLEAYYERGGPIPSDHASLCRIVAAQDGAERNAIKLIAAEFFTEHDGKLHHARCDSEIAKQAAFLARQSAKGKAGANARWNATGIAQAWPKKGTGDA